MPRFKFTLEALLRQRKRLERQRQRDLALLQRDMRQLEEELRQLGASMASTTQLVRSRMVGKLDMAFLAAHRRYLLSMQMKGQSLMQRMATLKPQIENRRGLLLAAAKDRKAIEMLRQRRLEQWQAEQNRKENAELDEISNQLFFSEPTADESFERTAG
jgi:flagellar FliJ protein